MQWKSINSENEPWSPSGEIGILPLTWGRENEKWPLHEACFSTSTCLCLHERSSGHVPCYLRASALIRNPSVFCAHTDQRGEGGGGGVTGITARKQQAKAAPPPKILPPSPTAWQGITAELCWVGELRLCYWWLFRPQISITQTQSLSRDMATVAAIEGVRLFALCHQSNQPTHTHTDVHASRP